VILGGKKSERRAYKGKKRDKQEGKRVKMLHISLALLLSLTLQVWAVGAL
jgi:hypothetical protein